MSRGRYIPPQGQVRASQVITTYGPGSMVDLPRRAVVIGGLDHWIGEMRPIEEDRLAKSLARDLGISGLLFKEPPVDTGERDRRRSGITSFVFPEWFLAQIERTWEDRRTGKLYRTRPLIPWRQLVDGRFLDEDRKKKDVVPVRFVRTCLRGHLDDIDWYAFVFRQSNPPRNELLWLDEGGSGYDFTEIFVRCGDRRRPLSDATVGRPTLGGCTGRKPWLGPRAYEGQRCPETSKLLVRSASHAYFSLTRSAISIPDADEALRQAVGAVYDDFLVAAQGPADIAYERRKPRVASALESFPEDERVWAEIQRRQNGETGEERGLREVELETFLAVEEMLGEDRPESDFLARRRDLAATPSWFRGAFERVVLVDRLRRVRAQYGFTRLQDLQVALHDDEGLGLDVRVAKLAEEPTWLPAAEYRGEGVFLGLRRDAVERWLARPEVQARGEQLRHGFEAWCHRRGLEGVPFPQPPYLLLHTLSHLLITAVALECGYSATALSERIYAEQGGYGLLISTDSPGSEGTLGGLIQVGESIERHVERALEMGGLCSNDPICAQHRPADGQEERFLHGAACHGCLLISESSCERRNEVLDRALVVPTVENVGAEFFRLP